MEVKGREVKLEKIESMYSDTPFLTVAVGSQGEPYRYNLSFDGKKYDEHDVYDRIPVEAELPDDLQKEIESFVENHDLIESDIAHIDDDLTNILDVNNGQYDDAINLVDDKLDLNQEHLYGCKELMIDIAHFSAANGLDLVDFQIEPQESEKDSLKMSMAFVQTRDSADKHLAVMVEEVNNGNSYALTGDGQRIQAGNVDSRLKKLAVNEPVNNIPKEVQSKLFEHAANIHHLRNLKDQYDKITSDQDAYLQRCYRDISSELHRDDLKANWRDEHFASRSSDIHFEAIDTQYNGNTRMTIAVGDKYNINIDPKSNSKLIIENTDILSRVDMTPDLSDSTQDRIRDIVACAEEYSQASLVKDIVNEELRHELNALEKDYNQYMESVIEALPDKENFQDHQPVFWISDHEMPSELQDSLKKMIPDAQIVLVDKNNEVSDIIDQLCDNGIIAIENDYDLCDNILFECDKNIEATITPFTDINGKSWWNEIDYVKEKTSSLQIDSPDSLDGKKVFLFVDHDEMLKDSAKDLIQADSDSLKKQFGNAEIVLADSTRSIEESYDQILDCDAIAVDTSSSMLQNKIFEMSSSTPVLLADSDHKGEWQQSDNTTYYMTHPYEYDPSRKTIDHVLSENGVWDDFQKAADDYQRTLEPNEKEADTSDKTKVFWFSRHTMTETQEADLRDKLGDIDIVQYDATVKSAYEVEDKAKDCDVLAVVAPIQLQQQFLKIAGDRPVITAATEKVMVPQPDGKDSKAEFVFDKWEQLDKIDVQKHDFDFEKDDEPHKVFWFSKHEMSEAQKTALKDKLGDDVEIVQYARNISSAYEVMDDARDCDVLAVVAPIQLQQQFLKIAEDRPVIMAVNDRVFEKQPDGTESKAAFVFNKWEQLDEINVEKHDFEGLEKDSPDLDFDDEER